MFQSWFIVKLLIILQTQPGNLFGCILSLTITSYITLHFEGLQVPFIVMAYIPSSTDLSCGFFSSGREHVAVGSETSPSNFLFHIGIKNPKHVI